MPSKKPAKKPERRFIVQIGNFAPPHSSENHFARALEYLGHEVERVQESDGGAFLGVEAALRLLDMPSFVLWTRTGWDWDAMPDWSEARAHRSQRAMLRTARERRVPVVGYHLDRWRGLKRESQVWAEPFFEVDLLVTADGSSDDLWAEASVNHVWGLPGVSLGECQLGAPRDEFASRLAFVGSHDGGYHAESEHRHDLVQWLKLNYRRDCEFWPKRGQHAIRGADLQDLYASVDVLVGDSAFAAFPEGRYASDRIPESLGRGGFLLHPHVEGVTDGQQTPFGPAWQESEHLGAWEANDWDGLGRQIEFALSHPDWRREVAAAGRAFTMEHHTYESRFARLIEIMQERGLL